MPTSYYNPWDSPQPSRSNTCGPAQYNPSWSQPAPRSGSRRVSKPLPRTIPLDDIPVRRLRDPRRPDPPPARPSLQQQIQQRRDSRAAVAAHYEPAGDPPLTDKEKDAGGGCLMFLVCIAVALFAYVSDASIAVTLPTVKIEKKKTAPTPPTNHATTPKK